MQMKPVDNCSITQLFCRENPHIFGMFDASCMENVSVAVQGRSWEIYLVLVYDHHI